MNLPGCAGESSNQQEENGDGISKHDRPLKKARFAWEVKGKYHLRNVNTESRSSTINALDIAGTSNGHECGSKLVGNTEQNLEILGDYLLKQDFNSLDSITENNASLIPSSTISSETLSCTRYVSSLDNSNGDVSESSSGVVYRTPNNKGTEDEYIARWQARQMAKCFVDNTINSVLDNWIISPLPAEMEDRVLALDAAEFINNLPSDNSVENKAILMAISAHGLQNNSSTSSNTNESPNSNKDFFLSPPSSPISETSDAKLNDKQIESQDDSNSWVYQENKQTVSNIPPSTSYPETPSPTYKYFNETENVNIGNIDFDENVNSNDDDIMNEFLEAAVTFAIQCKGLSSYGTEYG